jgi:hypothetical protein
MLRFAVLFWYTTLGAIIGIFGVFTYHPVLKVSMPCWFRDPFLGAWMNFVLTLFAYEPMKVILANMTIMQGVFVSPFWFVLEGAIIGWIIGYFAKRFGGEGKELLA